MLKSLFNHRTNKKNNSFDNVKIEQFIHKNIINNCKTYKDAYINLEPCFHIGNA